MEYKRSDRVGDLIHREIAEMLMRRVKDPRVAGVTITGVELTADLQHAKVFYCISGTNPEESRKKSVAAGLDNAKGFIRQELRKRLTMKHLPQIDFRYDASFEYGEKIERLIKEIHKDE
ncbi:MAG: 30S ribosome-binding factor RbfA [Syntrophobacteraceae bacterium]